MTPRRPPALALMLLRQLGGRHRDSLEGDLLEEFAGGRSAAWFWHQAACAVYVRARTLVRNQATTFLAAALFFLVALWSIAPLTYPVMSWARASESLDTIVLLAWLAGVPFVLGCIAGAAQGKRRAGAILLAACLVYLTPVTLPFTWAACDLCSRSGEPESTRLVQLFAPFASALLAGGGAWAGGRFRVAAGTGGSS